MTIKETIQDAFAYPFRENGKMVLIWGAILGVASHLASFMPMVGVFAVLILSAYFCAIFFDIILKTVSGSDDCAGFPDISDFLEDLIFPYLKVAGALIFSFLPLVISIFIAPSIVQLVAVLFGVIYFPMAILAVAVLGRFTAMGPQIVFPAIISSGGRYWLLVVCLLTLLFLVSYGMTLLEDFFILGALIGAFVNMLNLMINGRFLGLLYREKAEELNWV